MKKLSGYLVLLCAMAIMSTTIFTSCSKDDVTGAKKILMNEKWVFSSVETENEILASYFDLVFSLSTTTYEFKKDSVLEITTKVILLPSETDEGTWSMSDDGKQLTINGSTSEVIELTNKVLKLGPNAGVLGLTGEDADDYTDYDDYVFVFEAK